MNIKKTLILVVIAVVVCLAVFLNERPGKSPVSEIQNSGPPQQVEAFKGVNADSVAKIEITPAGKKESIILESKNKVWKVRDGEKLHGIDKYRSERLFAGGSGPNAKKFAGPLTLDFQAKNPENHKDFDLTEDKAIRVKFLDASGKTLEDILVGKSGTDYETTFVRWPGKNEVYLAPTRLNDKFNGAEVNNWRDRRVFPDFDAEGVRQLLVDDRVNTRTYELVKRLTPTDEPAASNRSRDGNWWITQPFEAPANPSVAKNAVRSLISANAAEFGKSEDIAKFGFDRPSMIASFSIKDQPTSVVLTCGSESPEHAGKVYAKTNLSDDVYSIYPLRGLQRSPSELKETPTPTPTPSPTISPTPEESPETTATPAGDSKAASKESSPSGSVIPASAPTPPPPSDK